MRTKGAVAEVFLTAFKTLPKKEKDIFLSEVMKDKSLREDLLDIAVAEERKSDRRRKFRDFLEKHGS